MPFVEYGTLADLVNSHPLLLKKIRAIIAQVGDALDYAHSRGLVHRDVEPSNVLIDERGNCLLTDFGIAKIVEGTAHLTTTGTIVGTPAYMSPEQGLAQKLDGRSDIYSLGVMLYQMATGQVPFGAETPMAIVIKHIHDPLPPPRSINPALPEALERVILKALAKNPEDRYQTAAAMVAALAETRLNDRPGRPLAESTPTHRWAFLLWAGMLAVVAALALVVGVAWLALSRRTTQEASETPVPTEAGARITTTTKAKESVATNPSVPVSAIAPSASSTLAVAGTVAAAPVIAYSWDFDIAGYSERWGKDISNDIEPIQVTQGVMLTRAIGVDPYLASVSQLRIDAAATPIIAMRMSLTAGTGAKIFFIGPAGERFPETQSLRFSVISDSQFHSYYVDMSSVGTWRGRITQLRLDPTDLSPTELPVEIRVDWIRVQSR